MKPLFIFACMMASLFSTVPTYAQEVDANALWNPRDGTWEAISSKCSRGKSKLFVSCIALNMRQKGASQQAVEFTKSMKGEVYLSSFREMGKVDLAEITAPLLNDPIVTTFILVNGSTNILDLWRKVEGIDITRDRNYANFVRRFPNVELWPMYGFDRMQKLSGGGQRFIFDFTLLNGCRGCEVAGSAKIAFDFDASGLFFRTSLIGLFQ